MNYDIINTQHSADSPEHSSDHVHTEVLFYELDSGNFRMDVQTDGTTVWLSLKQMAELFQRDKSVISRHINNVFTEGELERDSVVAEFATTAADGKKYQVDYFNLDVIISVGYRVKSQRGTKFRIWATQRLNEYLLKGFTMDDKRLKEDGNSRYFEELLARIRDIRSSEKVFWRKVLAIYASSIDYNPHADVSQEFFAKVQNQMHWAAHGHTAAEIIYERADANRVNMGVTNYPGNRLLKRDVEIAKNYLSEDELHLLNRIVTAYLELAEIQAMNKIVMHMQDWIDRLQQFLSITGRDILTHAGQISRDQALTKAHAEYQQYKQLQMNALDEVDTHFIAHIEKELKVLKRSKQ